MQNRLHKFLDDLLSKRPGKVRPSHYIVPEDEKKSRLVINHAETLATQAVCFAHEIEEFSEVFVSGDLVRLPFKVCWFDLRCIGRTDDTTISFLCEQTETGFFAHAFWYFEESSFWGHVWSSEVVHGKQDDGAVMSRVVVDNKNDPRGEANLQLWSFLTALNCNNVRRIEHKPKPSQQSVRRALGRQPLFSTWTLELDLSRGAQASEENGGTHASPRIHLRRGHARQYLPGKWCWVQPSLVGSKAMGMVHKDYMTKGT